VWEYGNLIFDYNTAIIVPFGKVKGFLVDNDTVGQFTGLHDKNGKEIYNGDILKATSRYNGKEYLGFVVDNVRGYCYDVVYINPTSVEKRWSLYAWVVSDKGNHNIEIVGTIHDNPDLLTTK
jgi:uncharacterized phage protein (TIGR01671 family)